MTTVPEIVVVAPPEQLTRRRQRPVHVLPVPPGVPHTLGVPPPPQDSPGPQVPQSRSAPQPSATGPQFACALVQVRGAQRGAPQTFAMPPPPQVVPLAQAPQLRSPPQPSARGPQVAPTLAQVRGTQVRPASGAPPEPQTLARPPPPQVVPVAQVPQLKSAPQPSATGPQLAPTLAQVRGTQERPASGEPPAPQTLGRPPPPHDCPAVQAPQLKSPPQPSATGPQLAPTLAQVRGTQLLAPGVPQTFARPPPPQDCGAVQVPHMSSPPQPSARGPQLAPASAQVRRVHEPVVPQVFGTPPPPHDCPLAHDPQLRRAPQPSATGPQFAWRPAQVRGTQVPASMVVVVPTPHAPL